jgi:hypothetical protein
VPLPGCSRPRVGVECCDTIYFRRRRVRTASLAKLGAITVAPLSTHDTRTPLPQSVLPVAGTKLSISNKRNGGLISAVRIPHSIFDIRTSDYRIWNISMRMAATNFRCKPIAAKLINNTDTTYNASYSEDTGFELRFVYATISQSRLAYWYSYPTPEKTGSRHIVSMHPPSVTSWSRFLENLTAAHLKLSAFYGTRSCSTAFTRTSHWSLSWAKCPYPLNRFNSDQF